MTSIIKKIVLGLLIVFIGIQFVPMKYNERDEILESDFIKTFNAPLNVQNILKASCYDCHSNNSHYSWYSKIQPVAWFMEGHINKGKEELNFSTFGDYSGRRKKSKLKSIISQIKDGEMPLSSYILMHRDAKLSDDNKELIIEWINNLRDRL